jgi:hypothetical protein
MKKETYIRIAELAATLASTYMVAVTLIQSSFYVNSVKKTIYKYIGFLLEGIGIKLSFFDVFLLGIILMLSLLSWRRGDETGFGRLFSLNMLMFFPTVVDFSLFNWVNLILPYDPEPTVSVLWVFCVGLTLQATYLVLRYTMRFRKLRDELLERGAELENVDNVSRGQIIYLIQLMLGTIVISTGVFYLVPFLRNWLITRLSTLPYPHIVIGVTSSLLITLAIILYLRGGARKMESEPLGNV